MGNAIDIDVWMQELCIEACTSTQVYVPLCTLRPKMWSTRTPCMYPVAAALMHTVLIASLICGLTSNGGPFA